MKCTQHVINNHYRDNSVVVREGECRVHGSHIRGMYATISQLLNSWCEIPQQIFRLKSVQGYKKQRIPTAMVETYSR